MTENLSASLNSPLKHSKYGFEKRRKENKRYQTYQSIKSHVDMSRMTGR